MKEALLSLLAGDIYGRTPIWRSLWLFKAIYYLTWLGNAPTAWRAWRARRRNIATGWRDQGGERACRGLGRARRGRPRVACRRRRARAAAAARARRPAAVGGGSGHRLRCGCRTTAAPTRARDWVVPVPYVVYRGDILKADREGARAVLFDTERLDFDVSVAATAPTHSSENEARQGMPDLAPTFEFGPNLNVTLARGPQWKLQLRAAGARGDHARVQSQDDRLAGQPRT